MKKLIKKILHLDVRLPKVILVVIRIVYKFGVYLREGFDALYSTIIVKPVMQAIAEGGRHLRIERIPYIRGSGRIELGDDVYISGLLGVSFLKRRDLTEGNNVNEAYPLLKIGNRTFIGHQCSFALSKSIEIGDDCLIANGTRFQDSDGHPLDMEARIRHDKVAVDDILPIKIGNGVWIAPRCTILKGVTIGDGVVVGTGSIVTRDVPSNTVVAGNPAREIRKC